MKERVEGKEQTREKEIGEGEKDRRGRKKSRRGRKQEKKDKKKSGERRREMNEIGEGRVYFQGVLRPMMPPDPIPFHLNSYIYILHCDQRQEN